MGATSIEWTDRSINPIRARLLVVGESAPIGHYCEKVSPGCTNCYASAMQKRFGMPTFKGNGVERGNVELFLDDTKLEEVLRRKKPTKFFWCDMTDLFGKWVQTEWIWRCWDTMAGTSQHVHQVLTKRPERMASVLSELYAASARDPLPNVWCGTSVENQATLDERRLHLSRCPAAVTFFSCEPLLGPLDLDLSTCGYQHVDEIGAALPESGDPWIRQVDWVIVGGESGPRARPMHPDWVRSIHDQCVRAGVPLFVKQDSGPRPGRQGRIPDHIWQHKEFPKASVPS